jgi:hypothetical protein
MKEWEEYFHSVVLDLSMILMSCVQRLWNKHIDFLKILTLSHLDRMIFYKTLHFLQ